MDSKIEGLAAKGVKVEQPKPQEAKEVGLIESVLNKVKQKEVPLRLDGGMLGIRG